MTKILGLSLLNGLRKLPFPNNSFVNVSKFLSYGKIYFYLKKTILPKFQRKEYICSVLKLISIIREVLNVFRTFG